jgi:hypothetical protein
LLPGLGHTIGAIIGHQMASDSVKKKNQDSNESLAKALASGDIINTGDGLKSNLSSKELQEKYGFSRDQLDEFYDQLGGSTDELKEFGE